MDDNHPLSVEQWKLAIRNAINAVGLETFKRTSMFMSANNAIRALTPPANLAKNKETLE